jgi:hypothetical protein
MSRLFVGFVFLALITSSVSADGTLKKKVPAPQLVAGPTMNLPAAEPKGNEAPEFGPPTILTALVDTSGKKYGYPALPFIWRFSENTPKVIFVCWEDEGFNSEKAIVKGAVESSWRANSGLTFSGWGKCKQRSAGIRIQIDDSGPHTKGLGKQLNGRQNGMVLNFTYNNWSPSCQADKTACNKSIAVHEFGHAIGLAHEHNRPDTPGECTMSKQGTNGTLMLSSWDAKSVMNYCNTEYNNNGILSETDVATVVALYCSPQKPGCKPKI